MAFTEVESNYLEHLFTSFRPPTPTHHSWKYLHNITHTLWTGMQTESKVYFYFVLVTEMWVWYSLRAYVKARMKNRSWNTRRLTQTIHTCPHTPHTLDTDKWDLSEIACGFSAMVMISFRAVKTLCIWSPSPLWLSTEANTHSINMCTLTLRIIFST